MKIERLTEAHVEDVVGLYPKDADRWRAEKAWRWRTRGRDWAFGAFHEGRLFGFRAASPVTLSLRGQAFEAAQVGGGGLEVPPEDPGADAALTAALVEALRAEGVECGFTAASAESVERLEAGGFVGLCDVYARNLYVGLDKVSARLSKAALAPLRRVAKEARKMRPKLVESELDPGRIDELAELMAADRPPELGVVKDAAYLRWRYLEDPRATYRLMTYRSRAGAGISAFAVVRRFEREGGAAIMHLDDFWTRRGSHRDFAKLLGELALVALSEQCDAVRCLAADGSLREQWLVSMSCIRKKVERRIMAKGLNDTADLSRPLAVSGATLVAGDLSIYSS